MHNYKLRKTENPWYMSGQEMLYNMQHSTPRQDTCYWWSVMCMSSPLPYKMLVIEKICASYRNDNFSTEINDHIYV